MATQPIAIIVDQPITIATGTHDIGPFDIPDDLTSIEFRMKRRTALTPTLWSDVNTTMQWALFSSYDGGVTFNFEFGTGVIAGGVRLRGDGITEIVDDFFSLSGLLPGIGRKFKATCNVVNGPLVSLVSVKVF